MEVAQFASTSLANDQICLFSLSLKSQQENIYIFSNPKLLFFLFKATWSRCFFTIFRLKPSYYGAAPVVNMPWHLPVYVPFNSKFHSIFAMKTCLFECLTQSREVRRLTFVFFRAGLFIFYTSSVRIGWNYHLSVL